MNLSAQQTAKVVKVWDGDSFNLLIKGKIVSSRLVNVDAPEMSQLWGKEAQKKVEELILGKDLIFESTGKDKYKRALVNLWIDGERLDSLIVRNGWAWHYVSFSRDEMLAELQQKAIEEKAGLWECGVECVCPPWLFRGYNYLNKMKYCSGCKKNFFINN
jgi:micrococcal nuclease